MNFKKTSWLDGKLQYAASPLRKASPGENADGNVLENVNLAKKKILDLKEDKLALAA